MKIISGGQTGVDRAALDAARACGLDCGGWCPRGRRAEDGTISPEYPLAETPTVEYAVRTEWNVRDADATLILTAGPLSGGTALTKTLAERLGKRCLVVDLNAAPDVPTVAEWSTAPTIPVLNIAGPRESTSPGIYDLSRRFLEELFRTLGEDK
jgi:hypothetical protein